MLSEINENLKALHETNKADRKIIETINKDIIDIYVKNKNLIDEILSIKNEIRSVLLSNNMNLSTNLQKKGKLIIQKENEIHTNNNQIKILSDKLNDVYTKIENTNNLINEELKNEQKIEQLSHLIGFKETSSNICLNDLIIKPD
jgi:vacuolar-type H+-ATPase subunit I/STV1